MDREQPRWLTHDHVITGVPENDWEISLAPGECIDVVPVGETDYEVRRYRIDEPLNSNFANGLQTNSWDWKELLNVALQSGEHQLNIGSREDGTCLDKICITTNPVPPTGMGGASTPDAISHLFSNGLSVASVDTYSISGIRLAAHHSGPRIEIQRADNGAVLSRKVIVR